MNSLTKQRYISTSIWSDDWFDSLSEREKLVYFYLLTNEHTNPAGVYQCTLKNARLEIGLDREEIERIMDKFAEDGKAFYYKDYIIIPKWLKHQKVTERSGLYIGAVKVIQSLPQEVKEFISDRRHYDWDISNIIGTVSSTSKDPIETHPQKNIDPPLKSGRPSIEPPPKNTSKAAHDSDLDLDLDSDRDIDIDFDGDPKQGDTVVDNLGEKRPPPKDLYIFIKETVKAHGFYIDEPVAKKIANSIPDPAWFTAEHSIIDLVAEKINDIYADKPKEERKKLFVSALTKWENIQDEYPDWLNKKIEADKERALEKLRNTPPPICPHCQTDMGGKRICPNCNGSVVFSDEKKAWQYDEPFDFSSMPSLSEVFRQQKKEKANSETAPPNDADIEF
jgi:hypothetical protein